MASLGHIAVGVACGRAFSADVRVRRRAAAVLSVVSLWPDVDVVGFSFGVKYGDPWGHRGATHSLALALAAGALSLVVARALKLPLARTCALTTLVAVSHPLLDVLTYGGGLGCALLWPFSNARLWSPVRFIPIAPIGMAILSPIGLLVMAIEVVLFSPLFLYAYRGLWPRPKPA